jgi:hypothetical protein
LFWGRIFGGVLKMRVLGWSSVTIWLWVVDGFFYSLVSFIVVVVLVYKGSCMWDLIWILCFVKRRIRWDCCAFVIMCRGRWGKCGWFKVKKFCVFWVVFVGDFFFLRVCLVFTWSLPHRDFLENLWVSEENAARS